MRALLKALIRWLKPDLITEANKLLVKQVKEKHRELHFEHMLLLDDLATVEELRRGCKAMADHIRTLDRQVSEAQEFAAAANGKASKQAKEYRKKIRQRDSFIDKHMIH